MGTMDLGLACLASDDVSLAPIAGVLAAGVGLATIVSKLTGETIKIEEIPRFNLDQDQKAVDFALDEVHPKFLRTMEDAPESMMVDELTESARSVYRDWLLEHGQERAGEILSLAEDKRPFMIYTGSKSPLLHQRFGSIGTERAIYCYNVGFRAAPGQLEAEGGAFAKEVISGFMDAESVLPEEPHPESGQVILCTDPWWALGWPKPSSVMTLHRYGVPGRCLVI